MKSILFLHGGALNRKMWQHQLDQFEGSYDVHAIDLPGHGKNTETKFTLSSSVKEIHRYIESHIKGKLMIVGLSLGGYVAISYMHQHPNRVSKLVLSGCCIQYSGMLGLLARMNSYLLFIISRKRFESMQINQLSKVASPTIVNCILEYGLSLVGARDSLREVVGKDFSSMISKFEVPVLLLNGESDKLNRHNEYRYTDVCSYIRVRTIIDCGHMCNLEKADAFSDIILEFIDTESA